MSILEDYKIFKHLVNNLIGEFQIPEDVAYFIAMFVSKNYNITLKEDSMQEETYTIKLDLDSMNEVVVKFLVTLYKDNREFDDGCIKDSILQVIDYCTTRDQYAIVKVELGD